MTSRGVSSTSRCAWDWIWISLSVFALNGCLGTNVGSGGASISAGGAQSAVVSASPTATPRSNAAPASSPQPLGLSVNATQVSAGAQVHFNATGGTGPYTYRLVSGTGGSIDGASGTLYTPSHSAIVALQTTDATGATASREIKVTTPGVFPSDPYFGLMIHMGSGGINADQGWSVRTDCSSIPVAVVDTGVDYTHPDLAANIYSNPGEVTGNNLDDDQNGYIDDKRGWNFTPRLSIDSSGNMNEDTSITGNNDPMDDGYHGTHVAGAIGAVGNNGSFVTGVCWKAKIIPVKVLKKVTYLDSKNAVQSYDFVAPSSEIVAGIVYAADRGAKVINLSVGGPDDGTGNLYKAAFDYASGRGALIVTAAGNDGQNLDTNAFLPAGLNHSAQITVAATDPGNDNALASFSNFSGGKVHIASPGVGNYSLFPAVQNAVMAFEGHSAGYGQLDGTSMATPLVSGALALFWAKYPSYTPSQVRTEFLRRARVSDALNGNVEGSRFLDLGELMYDR